MSPSSSSSRNMPRRSRRAGTKITVRHLLTMSQACNGTKLRLDISKKRRTTSDPEADPIGYVLARPIAAPPDAVWAYNGGGTDLLGNIIERVSGKSLEAFAREALFGPLGITDFSNGRPIQNGKVASAAGLRIRPRDAAKIGQLVLNKGEWAGRQIVSSEWIEQSIPAALPGHRLFQRAVLLRAATGPGRSISPAVAK